MSEYPKKPDRPTLYQYKLQLTVGRGGTGTVYRGLDPETGHVVALKLFHQNFFRNRWHQADVRKTAKRFKKLNHPNVVKIVDFISGDEGDVLVEEFVDGPDLQWYIENRPYNLDEMQVIAIQIINGLGYLHDNGFMHHDMKPGNVLFTRKGQAKLCDYSLGGTGKLLMLFDRGGSEQVTPMYVAPELIKKHPGTKLSDMYSLGGVLFYLFTREVPFKVDNLQRLYQCHLNERPMHPSVVNEECPRAIGDIIMRLMEKDPKKRFQNCDLLRIQFSEVGKRRI